MHVTPARPSRAAPTCGCTACHRPGSPAVGRRHRGGSAAAVRHDATGLGVRHSVRRPRGGASPGAGGGAEPGAHRAARTGLRRDRRVVADLRAHPPVGRGLPAVAPGHEWEAGATATGHGSLRARAGGRPENRACGPSGDSSSRPTPGSAPCRCCSDRSGVPRSPRRCSPTTTGDMVRERSAAGRSVRAARRRTLTAPAHGAVLAVDNSRDLLTSLGRAEDHGG